MSNGHSLLIPHPSSLFVTGTDTGVGKSFVTALLALRLRARGIDAGVMKPFASGCRREGGALVSDDAMWLKQATGVADDLDLINPIRYEEPLAPLAAARRAAELNDDNAGALNGDHFARCRVAFDELQRRHDCVLVEGVGGLLVPLQQDASGETPNSEVLTCAGLVNEWSLPVVVVARRTLGTINHTLLTCRVPLRAPARFAGLVFCDAAPVDDGDVAAQTGPALIAQITGLPLWGAVPHLRDLSQRALAEAAREFLSWP